MSRPFWKPKRDDATLIKLYESERFRYFKEIAAEMKMSVPAVMHAARRLGLKPRKEHHGKWNEKHAHLREDVMKYFLNHSWEETRAHFNLTASELKSLFTVAYRLPEFRHLRKDMRRHDSWTTKELLFLLKYAGNKRREAIARKLKRGTTHNVKEALARLSIGSRYVNGIPAEWFNDLVFGTSISAPNIKTEAGPRARPNIYGGNGNGDFRYRIVPWITAERVTKKKANIDPVFRSAFRAMAMFQRFIHETNSDSVILNRLKKKWGDDNGNAKNKRTFKPRNRH